MQQLPTSEIPPGSRLAKPVLDHHGRVLLKAGALLTAGVIERLQRWQISAVWITTQDSDAGETEPDTVETVDPKVWDQLFAAHGDNPEMARIHQAILLWSDSVTPSEREKGMLR